MKEPRIKTALVLVLIMISTASTQSAQVILGHGAQSSEKRNKYGMPSTLPDKKVPLIIEKRRLKGVIILDLNGKVASGETSNVLERAIRGLLKSEEKTILLNLANVSFIDSRGLEVIVSSFTTVKRADGKIKLLHATERISDLLTITKLITVFEIYDNESEAVESFDEPVGAPVRQNAPGKPLQVKPRAQGRAPRKSCKTQLSKSIRVKIRQLIADELGVDESMVRSETHLVKGLYVDDLDSIAIIMRIEDEFKVEIPDEEFDKLETVCDLFTYLEQLLKRRSRVKN